MATYQPAKKNTAFIIYTALVSQADTKLLKSGPTLAAGDFKVSTDGAAFANLTTLPTNTPSGVLLKISLSAAEMNGDNISVSCIDAAGAEWCDQLINIQTAARQIDDLAYPATSGRSMVVDLNGLVDANTVKIGPTGSGVAQVARDLGTSVVVGTNNDKTGYGLSATAVSDIWAALTSALTTVGSIGKLIVTNLDALISSRTKPADTQAAVTLVTTTTNLTTNNDKTGYSLTAGEHTNIVSDVNTALDTAGSELSSVPTTSGTLRQKINFLFQYFRNKKTVTATTETLKKEDASTTLGTSTVSDDGTTFTKGEMN